MAPVAHGRPFAAIQCIIMPILRIHGLQALWQSNAYLICTCHAFAESGCHETVHRGNMPQAGVRLLYNWQA